jgi:hypothetical protein
MKMRSTTMALTLVALALPVAAQHTEHQPATPPAGAPAMGGPEMEAMIKAMTPGEEHKHLARMAGDWTFTNTFWMAPGQPPMESTGTLHAEMALGGRYLQSQWTGNMMGQPFEGRGTEAFNNVSKQYESTWVDNMGTGIMFGTGTCDASGACNSKSETWDPVSGKKITMRSTVTWPSSDSFKMEMFGPGPDGKEYKMMEIVAKRKG